MTHPSDNSGADTRYRVPENEARLPGFVTIPEATRIVFRMLVPLPHAYEPLYELIPCKVETGDGKPSGVYKRRVVRLEGNKWKTRRCFIPIDSRRLKTFGIFYSLVRGAIFRKVFHEILLNNIKYSLICPGMSLENRPSTRELIYQNRKFTFSTGFVKRQYRGRTTLCVLLIKENALKEEPVLAAIRKLYDNYEKTRLKSEDIKLLSEFFIELRENSEPNILYTKQELFDACRHVLQAVRKTSLRYRVFIAQVWNGKISAKLRIPPKSGRQHSSRRDTADAAIKNATHKFLASRLAV